MKIILVLLAWYREHQLWAKPAASWMGKQLYKHRHQIKTTARYVLRSILRKTAHCLYKGSEAVSLFFKFTADCCCEFASSIREAQ